MKLLKNIFYITILLSCLFLIKCNDRASNTISELNEQNLVLEKTVKINGIPNIKQAKLLKHENFFFIIDSKNYKIYVFSLSGKKLDEFGSKGKAPGEFLQLNHELVVNNKFDFFISDQYSQLLTRLKFDKDKKKMFFVKNKHYDNNFAQITAIDTTIIAFNAFPTTDKNKMFSIMKHDFSFLSKQIDAEYDFYKVPRNEMVKYSILYSSTSILLSKYGLFRAVSMDGTIEMYNKTLNDKLNLVERKSIDLNPKVHWKDLVNLKSITYQSIGEIRNNSKSIIFPIFTKTFDSATKKMETNFSKIYYYDEKLKLLNQYVISPKHILANLEIAPLFLEDDVICFFLEGVIYFYKISN